jgi:hypothetical protein
MFKFKTETEVGHILFIFGSLLMIIITGFYIPYKNTAMNPTSINDVIEKIQNQRSLQSLKPLTQNSALMDAAQAQAEDMVKANSFSYTLPSGKNSWDYIKNVHYPFTAAAEFTAISDLSTNQIISQWSNNPIQSDAYLNTVYSDVGVGVATIPSIKNHSNARLIVVFLGGQSTINGTELTPAGGITLLSPWYLQLPETSLAIGAFTALLLGIILEIHTISALNKKK